MPRRLDAELRARLEATFRVEAGEHLELLTANLLALEAEQSPEDTRDLVRATFRTMHTLKGAARSVGMRDVERVCQACETVLSVLDRTGAAPGSVALARLDEAMRAVARLIADQDAGVPLDDLVDRVEAAAADPTATDPGVEPQRGAPLARPAPEGAIRTTTAQLDELLRRGEDLLTIKLAADAWVADAEKLVDDIGRCRAQLDRNGDGADLRALEGSARAMALRLRRDRGMIATAVDGVLVEARRVRMTPAATVLERFPMMVHDLAQSAGKDVEWLASAGDIEVDRHVLEAIQDPLIHIVRNAIDHGIETPEERRAAGKPPRGRVTAAIRPLEGGRVEIVVEDDGRGIDPDRVRDAAERAHETDTGAEAVDLILRPGVSTSFVVTDVSGRGLGLAIVAEQVQRIGGMLHLDSRPREGMRVRLIVPSTMVTFRGLPVRAGGRVFLLPIAAVDQVVPVDGAGALEVAALDALLELDPSPGPEDQPACAILTVGDERVGVRVDDVLADREVLVKDFAPPLVRVRHVAGAGLLGAGELVPILRPADLVNGVRELAARPAPVAVAAEPERVPTILVVDDAVTTRAMERSLLELAGYQVEVAVDGMDAWTMLRRAEFDLVVSDVDMPRMDGFELTTRIRADERLADLPVVLVTALEGRADKERGLEVGASAYVVKSSFEHSGLLETIRRLGVNPGGRS